MFESILSSDSPDSSSKDGSDGGDNPTQLGVADLLKIWYTVPGLAFIMTFMVMIRAQVNHRFKQGGEIVLGGNDAWYHLRMVEYTVSNWPSTMPFDTWTNFPTGTSVGQFGTLFDQLVATAALIIGLGSPTQYQIAQTLAWTPVVFGALTVIPTYLLAKRFTGRRSALLGALVLALLPGLFLQRTMYGQADHNGVEPFFQSLAILILMYALSVANEEMPVWELVATKDWGALKRPTLWSVAAGVAALLYLWVWPPGIILLGIVAIFFTVFLSVHTGAGNSPEPAAFVGAVSMTTVGVGVLPTMDTLAISSVKLSPIHAFLAFATALGCVFLAALAREWESRGMDDVKFPIVIAGILIGLWALLHVVAPSIAQFLTNNIQRSLGLSANAPTRTIAEARPLLSQAVPQYGYGAGDVLMNEYGTAFFTAVVGAIHLAYRTIRSEKQRAERTLMLVWTAIITVSAFTQLRFNYYLAIPVAVLNAYFVGTVMQFVTTNAISDIRDINSTHIITALTIALVVFMPLLTPVTLASAGGQQITTNPAWDVGQSNGPGDITQWDDALTYLKTGTPEEGTLNGANNSMDMYATTEKPTDGDYEYPRGSYGVLSWWDYGHWITVEGERIPNANPFQEGATGAANFFLAQDEEQAQSVLDERFSDEQAETRYVTVDWKMATSGSKFGAMTVFNKTTDTSDYTTQVYAQNSSQGSQASYSYAFSTHEQRYYDSMVSRLYQYHGSAANPKPVVVETKPLQGANQEVRTYNDSSLPTKTFDNMSAAKAYAEDRPSAHVGGIGAQPRERVDALEHYRLVHTSNHTAFRSGAYMQGQQNAIFASGYSNLTKTTPMWTKTFEKVPGATISGDGPANETVKATVQMQTPIGTTFNYTTYEKTGSDGEWSTTVPYSTTGYENYGPDNGHTNVEVQATGPYTVSVVDGSASETVTVTESQVLGENSTVVETDLNESSQNETA